MIFKETLVCILAWSQLVKVLAVTTGASVKVEEGMGGGFQLSPESAKGIERGFCLGKCPGDPIKPCQRAIGSQGLDPKKLPS